MLTIVIMIIKCCQCKLNVQLYWLFLSCWSDQKHLLTELRIRKKAVQQVTVIN